jgi:hypothetical protein
VNHVCSNFKVGSRNRSAYLNQIKNAKLAL